MCNCVRKCVGFHGFPQFVVILPVKRFAGDSRAKSPLPSHKKAPARNSTTFMTTSRSKERHRFEPTTQAVRTLQVADIFAQKLVATQFVEVELVGDCRGSALSRQVKQSNRAFSGSAMLYVPYICLKAEGVGGSAALHDAVETDRGQRPLRACLSWLRLQISALSLRQNLQG